MFAAKHKTGNDDMVVVNLTELTCEKTSEIIFAPIETSDHSQMESLVCELTLYGLCGKHTDWSWSDVIRAASRENLSSRFLGRSDTHLAVQPQKMAGCLTFRIYEVEGWY